jgi:hypothetical protein
MPNSLAEPSSHIKKPAGIRLGPSSRLLVMAVTTMKMHGQRVVSGPDLAAPSFDSRVIYAARVLLAVKLLNGGIARTCGAALQISRSHQAFLIGSDSL